MTTSLSPKAAECRLSGRIGPTHLERLAIVYVRQSTPQQIERNQESMRLQYALVERATQLGWSADQVVVIDDDLGRSGQSIEGRPGFQRLVAEVGLDHVGIILGIEMSRLARSCRDWYQLLEICAVFGTLLGDTEGIYDVGNFNDRLLLGLKGTMSEAELHVLKARMLAGRQAKAARGELWQPVPIGYQRLPSGEVVQDPDEEARAVVALIFAVFERDRTVGAVLRHLVDHQIALPCRAWGGLNRGQLEWHRPNRCTLGNILHNPIYAGAYVYGRRLRDPRRQQPGRPGTGRRVTRPDDWPILLKDRFPAYISWEHYERNLRQLAANTAQEAGVIRKGTSLLSGLLICGRCGLRMSTRYKDNGGGLRYVCGAMSTNYKEHFCQSIRGDLVDAVISQLVLRALEPAALEVSLRVAEDLEAEHADTHRLWLQRLERARYEAERAFRQYDAVEPENRLVVRTLEQRWEQALAAEAALKADYDRFRAAQPTPLSQAERTAIRDLALDLPALWHAPTTQPAERQEIVRLMLQRAVVTVHEGSENVSVDCHWIGGHVTQARFVRPVARTDQLSRYADLRARIVALHGEGRNAPEIARVLNDEGWHPPRRPLGFTAEVIRDQLYRLGLRLRQSKPCTPPMPACGPDEWTLRGLSAELAMPLPTLYVWMRRGVVKGRLDKSAGKPTWLISADRAEIDRLKALRNTSRTAARQYLPVP